ncbi:two-component regulator propeller domain-containing protein [uncultured Dokdonia sp.]|uniref:two-component regulator propeller domain-containing protein n=1 Tax=uncultured Dokdonia sp. TaxID=575653 RepID=UPI0026242F11|nr:two-component regulator propeller domain-containing protein [uncultured Dokdonia sp.]
MLDYTLCFKHKYFLYILFFWANISIAQNQPHFKNFTAIDGLSSNEVYDIAQDDEGYLWFATDRGLSRYDGTRFERFTTSDGLPDNVIYNFFESHDGTIWCSTNNNTIFYFKNAPEGFHQYRYNDLIKTAWPNTPIINDIIPTQDGDLLINYTDLKGYLKIDASGSVQNTLYRPTSPEILHSINIMKSPSNFMFIDNSSKQNNERSLINTQWNSPIKDYTSSFYRLLDFPTHHVKITFHSSNAFIVDTKTNEPKEINIAPDLDNIPIISGKYDNDHFWAGYQYGGVKIFNVQGEIKQHFLKGQSVTKVYRDHEGGLWASTLNAGIFYAKQPSIDHYFFDSYPIDLTKDSNNQLFASFHNGEILKREKNSFISHYTPQVKLPNHIQYDKNNNRLLSNDYLHRLGFHKSKTIYIKGLSDDENSTIMFNKKAFFTNEDNNFYTKIKVPYRIFDVSKMNNIIYIGTNNGLLKYENDSISTVNEKYLNYKYRISDIDSKFQNLYVATMGGGITIQKKDTIFSITQKDGLISNICTELYIEDKYTIWVGTNLGLQKITLFGNNKYEIETLSVPKGLMCSEITDIEIIQDTIWIASKEGVFSVPQKVINQLQTKYKKWFHIDEIIVDEKPISLDKRILLPNTTHNIKIHFKSISFKEGAETLYRYKIRDSDTEWNYTKNNTIDILNITPGDYQVSIQIKAEDNTWGNTLYKQITISLPYWKSSWFLFIIVTSISILLYLAFVYRVLIFNTTYLKKIAAALVHRIKKSQDNKLYVIIKHDGTTIKVATSDIGYFKSSRNYVEIYTISKKYLVRKKIDDFYMDLPDSYEFIKVHRSYYVRINKVTQKNGLKEVIVFNTTIPVSKTYSENLQLLTF